MYSGYDLFMWAEAMRLKDSGDRFQTTVFNAIVENRRQRQHFTTLCPSAGTMQEPFLH